MSDTQPMPASARALPAFWLVLLCAGGIFALITGARLSMGLFLGPINSSTGLGLASISLAFAFGQLWWGLTQPFAGMVADRIGPGRVLALGAVLVAVGTALVPYMQSTAGLTLAIGVLAAGGAGMAGPAVLMAAATRLVAPARRAMATGIVNAGGSFGQFMFVPLAQAISSASSWVVALQSLAVLTLLAMPAAYVLRGHAGAVAGTAPGVKRETTREALRRAWPDPSYRLLATGFFVCGFHVAFLAVHLPGVVASCGLSPEVGAWALGVLGLFNIAGSLGIGWAMGFQGGRWPLRKLLAMIYLLRGLAVLAFMLAPKTPTVMLAFAAVMGLTYLSTVPPTAALVVKFFGPAHMATLFGVVMVSHQMGGFFGAWLGGTVFEANASYDWMWIIDILLAFGAALVHLPIREARPVAPLQTAG